MGAVVFDEVAKTYPDGTTAVRGLNLEAAEGELLVLVGPSGCGKTSALRMVAGLEDITSGTVRIGPRVINHVAPEQRDIAMVFQNYALFPHLSVYDNLAFGLKVRRTPRAERDRRVAEIADILGLAELLKKKPRALSGGQRQRVAMGRAIVRDPEVLLMDEPLSNLDANLRGQLRSEIARIQRRIGATAIYVTHDQVEAMTMGDRIAVMRSGVLQQVGPPPKIFDEPANLFVASFVGSPPMNLLEATLTSDGDRVICRLEAGDLVLPERTLSERPALRSSSGRAIAIGIRPEAAHQLIPASEPVPGRTLRGVLTMTEFLGTDVLAHVEMPATPVTSPDVLEVVRDLDEALIDGLSADAAHRRANFIARLSQRQRTRREEAVGVLVDVDALTFFDLATGDQIPRQDTHNPGDTAPRTPTHVAP